MNVQRRVRERRQQIVYSFGHVCVRERVRPSKTSLLNTIDCYFIFTQVSNTPSFLGQRGNSRSGYSEKKKQVRNEEIKRR